MLQQESLSIAWKDETGAMQERREWRTLPSVVFGIEKKVRGHDRHTHGDHGENEKDEQHETVDIVDLKRERVRESTASLAVRFTL